MPDTEAGATSFNFAVEIAEPDLASQPVARTSGTTSRLDLVFPTGDAPTKIDRAIETVKNQETSNSGKNPETMIARVGERLAENRREGSA